MPSSHERVLVTGGAGFVGSSIALALKNKFPEKSVTALDNLKRRGSELILRRLHEHGVRFVHGDIRSSTDFPPEEFDLMVECSAEASVLAGYGSSPEYLLDTNLTGAMRCLEFCRQRCPRMIFISTSRVYSVPELSGLRFREEKTRFVLEDNQKVQGASAKGIDETFPTSGPRSLYGTTKLAAEMLIEEYRHAYGLKAVINRCGVVAGPWQMGKGDQGIFTYWLASHYFKRPLRYINFGGRGKQVRDLLHAADLAELVIEQAEGLDAWDGVTANVGGGSAVSLSLVETTELCAGLTGNAVAITPEPKERPMDIPCYLSHCARLFSKTKWRPQRTPERVLSDTLDWIRRYEADLKTIL
jgi:CDP-paratose 2-epimerase